jgi:hypothetical protein
MTDRLDDDTSTITATTTTDPRTVETRRTDPSAAAPQTLRSVGAPTKLAGWRWNYWTNGGGGMG